MKNALSWVKKNRISLSIRSINDQIGMPTDTLIKAVSGAQNLPKKWLTPLTEFVNELLKK